MRRLLELLAFTLAAGALAAAFGVASWLPVLGSACGALLWFVFDALRARRVLDWLRHGSAAAPPLAVGVWAEVVERARKSFKILNRKARKSEARLQEFLAAIQASPIGVVLLDKSSAIEWSNFTAAQHLGFDPKRDLKQPIRHLVRAPEFNDYLVQGDYAQAVEIDGRDATPGHPQRISINLYLYGKGRRLMLTREITAVELAEAMRRDFVANVSHELRSPLTALTGFIETLRGAARDDAAARERFLAIMEREAGRMNRLVRDLLHLSRVEAEERVRPTTRIALVDVLKAPMASLRPLAEASGVRLVLEGEEVPSTLPGDADQLVQVFQNLIENAVKYGGAGGVVTVRLSPDRLPKAAAVRVDVIDRGEGIDEVHLPRLTERFYRVDSHRAREKGGTGLGLAIVKHIIQRHRGRLHVQSRKGEGSTFSVILPLE